MAEMKSEKPQMSCNLNKLRSLVRSYIEKHQYESALFWANKLVTLSNNEALDVYWYAQTLFLTRQYHRAMHLLKLHHLEERMMCGRHLAATCHFECRELQEALDILDFPTEGSEEDLGSTEFTNMKSSINLLRGKIYEAMENRSLASECFREALRSDVFCYEAYEFLTAHHMLSSQEEIELLASLPFESQCSPEEQELVQHLYELRLKKYSKPGNVEVKPALQLLKNNLDVVIHEAEQHYYNCDFRECHRIASTVLKQDPYNSQCMPLYVSVLMELKMPNELFYLAHKLVDLYPEKAVAWFAVGCYYFLVGKHEPARRYLSKATSLDRVFGPAWLAFGHSFAAENEHDQAMAAYFTASQVMKGCHLPVLYIGLEYGLTNNPKLAERFFSQALLIASEDPFVLHEMGVISFQNQKYEQAESYLMSALEQIQMSGDKEVMVEKWEPLLSNLGHVCRKLKKYDEALDFHRQALVLSPQNPSTFSAMGFIFSLSGQPAEAIDYFHKALGLRRDDTFSTTMLCYAIEELMLSDISPCEGAPDDEPNFPSASKMNWSELQLNSTAETTFDDDNDKSPSFDLQPVRSVTGDESGSNMEDMTMADSSSMMVESDLDDA